MTSAEAVEMSVTITCNSLSQDYTNLDDHILQTSIATYLIKNNIYIPVLHIFPDIFHQILSLGQRQE